MACKLHFVVVKPDDVAPNAMFTCRSAYHADSTMSVAAKIHPARGGAELSAALAPRSRQTRLARERSLAVVSVLAE